MTYEYSHYPQTRRSDFVQEAQFIAQEMDRGNSRFAVQRLQQDLYQLQGYPGAQKELLRMVENFEEKGRGADLETQMVRGRDGRRYADVSAVDYRTFSDGYSTWREPYSVDRIALVALDRYSNLYERDPRLMRQYGGSWQQQGQWRGQQQDSWQGQRRMGHHHNHQHGDYGNWSGQNTRRYSMPQGRIDYADLPEGLTPQATMAFAAAQQMALRDGVNIDVSSAGRTYAEQAQLYRELRGKSPVAAPGTSNHERGIAIDVRNYAQAKPYLLAAGFVHGDGAGPIKNDPWHFKFVG